MHQNSALLFERHAKPLFRQHMRVLEIGPDGCPSSFQKIVGDQTIRWETLDLFQSDKLTYVARGEYDFPIEDESFDAVVSGNVIEHVKKTWLWMREIARVCKPGAFVVTVNPVNWPFHENPVDCWRIYPDGMRALHEEAGLTTVLAVFGSLDQKPMAQPNAFELFKWGAKKLLGKTVWLPRNAQTAIDSIAIGRKDVAVMTQPSGN